MEKEQKGGTFLLLFVAWLSDLLVRRAQQGMRLSFLVWELFGLNVATAAAAMAIFSLKLAKQFQKTY